MRFILLRKSDFHVSSCLLFLYLFHWPQMSSSSSFVCGGEECWGEMTLADELGQGNCMLEKKGKSSLPW